MFNTKLGIIFINGENLIECVDVHHNDALDYLHQLSSLKEDVVNLWDKLIAAEKRFFGNETIKNGVKEALDNFFIAAVERSDIDTVDIEDIYYINGSPASLVDIIKKLDNIEDEKIKELYHSIVNKEELYNEFCIQCNKLFNRISREISTSKGINSQEYKIKCNLQKIIAFLNEYFPVNDYAIGILAQGDSTMSNKYGELFPWIQKDNIIIVPHDDYGRYEMNSECLYHSIETSYKYISNFSVFGLIDTNENNIKAAKKAGWNGTLMRLKNQNEDWEIFCSLVGAITNFMKVQNSKKQNPSSFKK